MHKKTQRTLQVHNLWKIPVNTFENSKTVLKNLHIFNHSLKYNRVYKRYIRNIKYIVLNIQFHFIILQLRFNA